MIRVGVFFLGLMFSISLQAFPCFLTLVKDNCWTNYNVSVALSNAQTAQLIATIAIPQGQSWTRQAFECQPSDTVSVMASFTPVFWQSDAGKTYPGAQTWQLPDKVATGDTAWNITVCYSKDFLGVPLPPEASGQCLCDTTSIPPVKPQQPGN